MLRDGLYVDTSDDYMCMCVGCVCVCMYVYVYFQREGGIRRTGSWARGVEKGSERDVIISINLELFRFNENKKFVSSAKRCVVDQTLFIFFILFGWSHTNCLIWFRLCFFIYLFSFLYFFVHFEYSSCPQNSPFLCDLFLNDISSLADTILERQ